ncbi:MAG TPA: serine hydrolase domain-containing protein [Fimbriimonadaceae bacterium]|jgi:CubicO group peptidase (beta-lactamase class C family)
MVRGTPAGIVDELVHSATGSSTKAIMVAIVEKGKLVFSKGYGDSGSGTPDLNTVFYIGSLSKAVTGYGLMKLVDQGKVALRKEVGTYVPNLPESWAKIPLLNYVTHTSGIPGVGAKASSFQNAVDNAANKPIFFEAGSDQKYNNFNFAIAGQVIEHVSGKSYLDYMTDNVFGPIGMSSTGVGITKNLVSVPNYPDVAKYGTPSGGLESSAGDLVRWFQYMYNQEGMSPHGYRLMYTPLVPTHPSGKEAWNFTPGWQARFASGDEIVAKDGGVVGFFSMMQMVPDKGVCVILLEAHAGVGKTGTHLWPLAANILRDVYGYAKPAAGSNIEVETGE